MVAEQFTKNGGKWLGEARKWIQHKFIHGDRVTWGSNEILGTVTVRDIEEVAKRAAEAAIREYEQQSEFRTKYDRLLRSIINDI